MNMVTIQDTENQREGVLLERMTFGWWNTSLSPLGKERADQKHKEIAGDVVKSLINDLKIDCLALGEITNNDLLSLKDACASKKLAIYDGTLREGKLQFDTGIIYDPERLRIVGEKSITSVHGGRNSKIANRIELVSTSDNSLFHLFVSHWPSRGTSEETVLRRETIASRLKDQITAIEERSKDPAIILLGDFNDEPFDKSLSWNLLATRDRHLAQTRKGFLYNPFWRRLGEFEPHVFASAKCGAAGTYFYKNGTATRWHTFDQILFSSAFLGTGEWHLNERDTMILQTEFLVDLVQNEAALFDHLPILSVIERIIE